MQRWIGFGLVCAALFVAGCSGDKSSTDGATSSAPNADGSKKLRIAVIPKGATHEFWKSVHEGANKAAAEDGAEVVWAAPQKEDDKEQQGQIIETQVTNKVDGIVLAPLDASAMVAPVTSAIDAKVPVLIIDSALNGANTVSFVATDNEKGGHLAGAEMARLLGGKGQIVVLRYAEGSASTMAREKGFIDEIKKNPGIKIVSDNQYAGATVETAQKASENLLSPLKKGDGLSIDGIYTPNESSTFGMLRVLQDNKWTGKVKFVGFDSSPKLIDGLKANEINALVIQNPRKMGYEGVKTIIKYIKGDKSVPKTVDTGAALVTKENLTKPEIAETIAPPKE